jgi:hypothetical protein
MSNVGSGREERKKGGGGEEGLSSWWVYKGRREGEEGGKRRASFFSILPIPLYIQHDDDISYRFPSCLPSSPSSPSFVHP